MGANLYHEAHTNDDVEEEVTMEEPETGVIGSETENDVTIVGHC